MSRVPIHDHSNIHQGGKIRASSSIAGIDLTGSGSGGSSGGGTTTTVTGSSIFVNVKDFGAVGDGTTDDTAVIQGVIDAYKETGATIFFPLGTYLVTAQLDVDSAAATAYLLFLGEGGSDEKPASVINMTTANTTAFKGNSDAYVMAFENLYIKGPTGGSSGAGIWGNGRNIQTRNVRVEGFFYGIRIGTSSYYSRLDGTLVYNSASHGIWQESGSNNLMVNNCHVTTTGGVGIKIDGSQSTKIIGGSVENTTSHGISVDTVGGQTTDGTYIGAVYFENNGSACIYVGDTAAVRSTTILGCMFTSPQTGYFIDVEAADYITIGANHFLGTPSSGDIRLQTGITHAVHFNNRPSGVGNTYTSTPVILENLGAASFATPSIALGTSAAAGAASTVIRSDATIVAFDATVPVTQAFSDSAATGSASVAARRDHVHGMPASPAVTGGTLLIADTHSTPLVFADLLQTEAQDDLLYAD